MLKRAQEIAAVLKKADEVHIVTHIDADGITAGAIAQATIQRLGKTSSIECVKQLDEVVIKKLLDENHELVWFTDLGSGIASSYPELRKIITDHHECPIETDSPNHLNPHLFGKDGSYEIKFLEAVHKPCSKRLLFSCKYSATIWVAIYKRTLISES